jgi:hypothetical protein
VFPALPLSLVARLDLAAASGIRRRGDRLYVIADDELELGVYDLDGRSLERIPLADGVLPEDPAARKAHKPDFEALVTLPDGSLLALGSGSTPKRRRAMQIALDPEQPRVRVFSLDELYTALEEELPDLNIEGGAILADRLWLCSRGNSSRRDDALIELELAGVLAAFERERSPSQRVVLSVVRIVLGELEGAPLSITDLTPIRGRLVFTAAAESSPNTYDDGECAGSVVGQVAMSVRGAGPGVPEILGWVPDIKLEGVCAASEAADERALLLVADGDDRSARAPLFRSEPVWPD